MASPGLAFAIYPEDVLKTDPQFRRAYGKLIGKTQERWLSHLSGPQRPDQRVQLGPEGEEYLRLEICKADYCDTDQLGRQLDRNHDRVENARDSLCRFPGRNRNATPGFALQHRPWQC